MKSKEIPWKNINGSGLKTAREFRTVKRQQLDKLRVNLFAYMVDCDCCPDYEFSFVIDKALRRMIDAHSIKNWGR